MAPPLFSTRLISNLRLLATGFLTYSLAVPARATLQRTWALLYPVFDHSHDSPAPSPSCIYVLFLFRFFTSLFFWYSHTEHLLPSLFVCQFLPPPYRTPIVCCCNMPRKTVDGMEYIEVTYQDELYHVPVDYIMNVHPGGPAEIMDYENKDITEAFIDQGHTIDAEMEMQAWHVTKSTAQTDDAVDATPFLPCEETERKAETTAWRRRNTALAITGGLTVAVLGIIVVTVLRKKHT